MGIARKGGWLHKALLILLAVVVLCAIKATHDTLSAPVVRETEVALPGFPANAAPVRILVMSDLHVAGPDMPPSRLASIVAQANALKPDYVFIAGDLVSDKRTATVTYSVEESVAPLAALRPGIATVTVLGNHDHWRAPTEMRSELAKAGIYVLTNEATRLGPLSIGGLDDDFTSHADPDKMVAALRKLPPPYVVLSHSPNPFPKLPGDIALMVAGHTHCGQIRFPLYGAPAYMSRYGDRYACGRINENGRTLVVSAGLGTSILPIRFGTRPDMWQITAKPRTQSGARTEVRTPPAIK